MHAGTVTSERLTSIAAMRVPALLPGLLCFAAVANGAANGYAAQPQADAVQFGSYKDSVYSRSSGEIETLVFNFEHRTKRPYTL